MPQLFLWSRGKEDTYFSVLRQLANKLSPLSADKDQRAVVRRVTGRNWQMPKRKPSCLFEDSTVTVASCWDVCKCTKKFALFVFKEKFSKEPLKSCPVSSCC